MKNALIPARYQGLWRSVGYNRILEIGANGYAIYTATAAEACLCERGSAPEFDDAFDRIEIDANGQLSLFHAHDLTRYGFERLRAWDPACRVHHETCEDSAANFHAFCEVFAENYAFFALRGVDWPATCDAARRRLGAAPTPHALAEELERMIAPLADLHVYVSTPTRKIRSLQVGRGPRQALKSAFGLATPLLSARSSTEKIAGRMRHTLLRDFAATLERFRQAGNDVVAWGTLCPGVGYLNLLRMFGFAASEAARSASDLPHRTAEVGPFMGADMQALERILDDAMAELADHKALIIDVRLNGGGFDRAGILLCERLIDAPRAVYTKKARCRPGFTDPQTMTLTPARGPRFSKPVFLLTSALTVSAGEVFALAMSALPGVTLLGEPTQGVLSDNLFHRLPCGWEVSLSNEVYESLDGLCYEADGVPPDVRLPALDGADLIAELSAGLRIAAERASAV
jgi:carboxyl-terminal processing protease